MLKKISQIDKELLIFLNNLGNEYWDGFWLFMTNKYTSIPVYLFLAFLFYKNYGVKKTIALFLVVIVIITSSDQLSNIFKFGCKRLRPCHNNEIVSFIRLVKASCGGKYSYFSAHASTSMALATFFSFVFCKKYKNILYFLLLFAFLIGYSRIYIGVHFPFDVLTGFIMGSLIGYLYYKLFQKLLLKL